MNTYKVAEAAGYYFVVRETKTNQYDKHEYFAGYDPIGSAIWEKRFSFSYAVSGRDEAEQIIKDLEAADAPAEPEHHEEKEEQEEKADRRLVKEFKNGNKLWEIRESCMKCGGTGIIPQFYHIQSGYCFDCSGKGWYFRKETEYTPENLAKMEAKRAKEAAARAEEAQRIESERLAREAEWKREQAEIEAKIRGHYFGEVGQKVEIEVTYTGCSSFSTVFGVTTIYRFDTSDGAHLIWKTSADLGGEDFYIIDDDKITIRATIKAHKEWNGIEQTELTRVKVTNAAYKMRKLTRGELEEAAEKQKTLCGVEYACWLRELYTRCPNDPVKEAH